MKKYSIPFIILILFSEGCKTHSGEFSPLSPPTTQLFLSKINLPDSLSSSGLVHLYWNGDSKNGFIKGFDIAYKTGTCDLSSYSLNQLNWQYTPKNDSSFIFPIPPGQKYFTVSFYARAIDNNGLKDVHPVCLEVPIKDAPPQISFIRTNFTDTIHLVLSLKWSSSDVNGLSNLDSVYLKINDGNWVSFPGNVNNATLVPQDPQGTSSTSFKILTGSLGTLYSQQLNGALFNGINRVYLKAKDISNSYSVIDTTNVFYLKAKTGDLLILDSYQSTSNVERSVYDPILKQVYPTGGYDVYDFNLSNNAYIPSDWNIAFSEYIKLYKKIFWFTDAGSCANSPCTELGSNAIQSFLNNGGSILFSQSQLSSNTASPLYQIIPFDSISTSRGQVRIASGSKAFPVDGNLYDTLVYSQNLFVATPGYIKSTATPLFLTQDDAEGGWMGPNIIAATLPGSNNKPNVVFFSVDLYTLNGSPNGLKNLFDQILNKEFSK